MTELLMLSERIRVNGGTVAISVLKLSVMT